MQADLPPLLLHFLLPGPQQGDVLLPAPCIAHHIEVVPSLGEWIGIQEKDDVEDVDDLGDEMITTCVTIKSSTIPPEARVKTVRVPCSGDMSNRQSWSLP